MRGRIKSRQNYRVVRIGDRDWYEIPHPPLSGQPWHLRRTEGGFEMRFIDGRGRLRVIDHTPPSDTHRAHMRRSRLGTMVEWSHRFAVDEILGIRPVVNACCRSREKRDQEIDELRARQVERALAGVVA